MGFKKKLKLPGKNKYHNQKTAGTWYGETVLFDSKREANRAAVLWERFRKGEIQDLNRQVPFKCNIGTKTVGKKTKPNTVFVYRADFTYLENGEKVIEDVKSAFTAKDKIYRLKKKILEALGIKITEVIL